jgi:hypothetical protein
VHPEHKLTGPKKEKKKKKKKEEEEVENETGEKHIMRNFMFVLLAKY